MSQQFIRDKRSPCPKDLMASIKMSKIPTKGTKPENIVKKYLYERGFRGYRLNYKKITGRPDICFTRLKIAIFINGCFWHKCPLCNLPLPKNNSIFWSRKFDKNVERDKIKTKILNEDGWKVITIWECQLYKSNSWKYRLVKNLNKIINETNKSS